MSVRAYLVHEDVIYVDDKRYVHEEHEFLWNNWSDSEVWDIIISFANDMTNEDCIGVVEVVSDCWDKLKMLYNCNEEGFEQKIYKVVNKHKDVFQKIDTEFKKGNDWITIKLY